MQPSVVSLSLQVVALTSYHAALSLALPRYLYVPTNICVGAAVCLYAALGGSTIHDLGLSLGALDTGLLFGGIVSLLVWGCLLALRRYTTGRRHQDPRYSELKGRALGYELFVRLPFGTVIPEELIFRGVLFGAARTEGSLLSAVLVSSVPFGIWHIGPAIAQMRSSGKLYSQRTFVGRVVLTVAATFAAGCVFCLLVESSNSILASAAVHFTANAGGILLLSSESRGGVPSTT